MNVRPTTLETRTAGRETGGSSYPECFRARQGSGLLDRSEASTSLRGSSPDSVTCWSMTTPRTRRFQATPGRCLWPLWGRERRYARVRREGETVANRVAMNSPKEGELA